MYSKINIIKSRLIILCFDFLQLDAIFQEFLFLLKANKILLSPAEEEEEDDKFIKLAKKEGN